MRDERRVTEEMTGGVRCADTCVRVSDTGCAFSWENQPRTEFGTVFAIELA